MPTQIINSILIDEEKFIQLITGQVVECLPLKLTLPGQDITVKTRITLQDIGYDRMDAALQDVIKKMNEG